jgi:hypothetical protein
MLIILKIIYIWNVKYEIMIYSTHITQHKLQFFYYGQQMPKWTVNWYIHLEWQTQLEEMMQLASNFYN